MRPQRRAAVSGEAESEDAGRGQPGAVDGESGIGQAGRQDVHEVGGPAMSSAAAARNARPKRGSDDETRDRTGSVRRPLRAAGDGRR